MTKKGTFLERQQAKLLVIYELLSELTDVYEHYSFHLPNVTIRISEIILP